MHCKGITLCLIGDVSDKGVPAALFMSMSKTAIRLISADAAEQTGNVSPSRVLMKVNRELCRNNPLSMFVTLFYGVLDLEKGTLKYANAGHNPPLIMTERGNRKAEFLEKGKGGMLAVYQGVEFEEKTITLHPDDVLIFCQGTMPSVNFDDGKLLMSEKDRVAASPDGHGGFLASINAPQPESNLETVAKEGILAELQKRGIDTIFYFQVDNPLIDICSPEFIGYHLLSGSEFTSQVIR